MPYQSTTELPDDVREKYTDDEQAQFVAIFNATLDETGDESAAFAAAHGALRSIVVARQAFTPEQQVVIDMLLALPGEAVSAVALNHQQQQAAIQLEMSGWLYSTVAEDGIKEWKLTANGARKLQRNDTRSDATLTLDEYHELGQIDMALRNNLPETFDSAKAHLVDTLMGKGMVQLYRGMLFPTKLGDAMLMYRRNDKRFQQRDLDFLAIISDMEERNDPMTTDDVSDRWEIAVENLLRDGLIEEKNGKYYVTDDGRAVPRFGNRKKTRDELNFTLTEEQAQLIRSDAATRVSWVTGDKFRPNVSFGVPYEGSYDGLYTFDPNGVYEIGKRLGTITATTGQVSDEFLVRPMGKNLTNPLAVSVMELDQFATKVTRSDATRGVTNPQPGLLIKMNSNAPVTFTDASSNKTYKFHPGDTFEIKSELAVSSKQPDTRIFRVIDQFSLEEKSVSLLMLENYFEVVASRSDATRGATHLYPGMILTPSDSASDYLGHFKEWKIIRYSGNSVNNKWEVNPVGGQGRPQDWSGADIENKFVAVSPVISINLSTEQQRILNEAATAKWANTIPSFAEIQVLLKLTEMGLVYEMSNRFGITTQAQRYITRSVPDTIRSVLPTAEARDDGTYRIERSVFAAQRTATRSEHAVMDAAMVAVEARRYWEEDGFIIFRVW